MLNYPVWWFIPGTIAVANASMEQLYYEYDQMVTYCQDTTLLGSFSENQDNQRFAYNTKDMAQLKTALAWIHLSDGIPITYYGAEQEFDSYGTPANREPMWKSGYNTSTPLYDFLYRINTVRNAITNQSDFDYWSGYWTYKSKAVLIKEDMLAMRKGYDRSILAIITNRGENASDIGPYVVGDTNFISGDTLVDVISCDTMTAGEYGVVTVTIKKGEPQVSRLLFPSFGNLREKGGRN